MSSVSQTVFTISDQFKKHLVERCGVNKANCFNVANTTWERNQKGPGSIQTSLKLYANSRLKDGKARAVSESGDEYTAEGLADKFARKMNAAARANVESIELVMPHAGVNKGKFSADFMKALREQGFNNSNLCVSSVVLPHAIDESFTEGQVGINPKGEAMFSYVRQGRDLNAIANDLEAATKVRKPNSKKIAELVAQFVGVETVQDELSKKLNVVNNSEIETREFSEQVGYRRETRKYPVVGVDDSENFSKIKKLSEAVQRAYVNKEDQSLMLAVQTPYSSCKVLTQQLQEEEDLAGDLAELGEQNEVLLGGESSQGDEVRHAVNLKAYLNYLQTKGGSSEDAKRVLTEIFKGVPRQISFKQAEYAKLMLKPLEGEPFDGKNSKEITTCMNKVKEKVDSILKSKNVEGTVDGFYTKNKNTTIYDTQFKTHFCEKCKTHVGNKQSLISTLRDYQATRQTECLFQWKLCLLAATLVGSLALIPLGFQRNRETKISAVDKLIARLEQGRTTTDAIEGSEAFGVGEINALNNGRLKDIIDEHAPLNSELEKINSEVQSKTFGSYFPCLK